MALDTKDLIWLLNRDKYWLRALSSCRSVELPTCLPSLPYAAGKRVQGNILDVNGFLVDDTASLLSGRIVERRRDAALIMLHLIFCAPTQTSCFLQIKPDPAGKDEGKRRR